MAKWEKTYLSKKRRKGKIETIDGVDHFQERPIISRDMPIDGGVYLSEGPREAIVVDSDKFPEIDKLYKEAKKRMGHARVFDGIPFVLHAVYETVSEAFPHKDDKLARELAKPFQGDKKVSLDVFIKKGIGVCKHLALTSAVLLEKFKKDGLKGDISVDRNYIEGKGGHAWCRFTDPKGQVYIIDVMQGVLDTLEGSEGKAWWSYKRPGE